MTAVGKRKETFVEVHLGNFDDPSFDFFGGVIQSLGGRKRLDFGRQTSDLFPMSDLFFGSRNKTVVSFP